MRKWVKFDKRRGLLVDELDEKRLRRTAVKLKEVCSNERDNIITQEVYRRYSATLLMVEKGECVTPLSRVPSLRDLQDVHNFSSSLRAALSDFDRAVLGMDAIRGMVGLDEFYNNEKDYLKYFNGDFYIYEFFE